MALKRYAQVGKYWVLRKLCKGLSEASIWKGVMAKVIVNFV
ncbi:MAG: hypothetical protein V8Q39_11355 [Anaerovoracaceae bacterium]